MRINLPETGQKRIVVVGGGFGGLTLVKRLARLDYQVVLLDRNNFHQFQPLFYQVAMAGLEPSSIVFPLRKLFQRHSNVFIRVTEVEGVNLEARHLRTPYGIVNYDYLVLAIGADTNFFGNEHLARRTLPMKSVSEALFLRNAILDDLERALVIDDYEERQGWIDIVIVGGGATGVEVAGSLAEMRRYIIPKDYPELNASEMDIYLIQGGERLLPGMSEKASAGALHYLQELGVEVILNTRVTDYDGTYVFTNTGRKLRSKKVIWAAGIVGNRLEGLPDSVLAPGNRLRVNPQLQVEGLEGVFAIGDVAYLETPDFPHGHPQVAQAAIQQGAYLARYFRDLQTGKATPPFRYRDKGSMATIGRHRAVVDLPRWKFRGAFAWFVWLFVHLWQLIGARNKVVVFLNWVWNYVTYDQSLRLLIRPVYKKRNGNGAEKT
ncbi:MAG: NAD(P)/FAD-dependent oxidoreductase [Bacteroidetes bacterium]|nr:MAG: NAD(P)/FAD-dependent oxidoreductase [Bacteroidota bacterium]